MFDFLAHHYAHLCIVVLIAVGFFGMVAKRNLVKKLIGMSVLQSAIILFWLVTAFKKDGTIPILIDGAKEVDDPSAYMSPLPHTLMLTAIVVAVVTSGVAIALLVRIYRNYGSLEEDRILEQL
ncbi:MAG: cation:proton antiporter subunit C [Planctomycetota bacterium]|jgi:multicomponent Na+:H+ antiporter subunit C